MLLADREWKRNGALEGRMRTHLRGEARAPVFGEKGLR